jgi:hypothetical protein
MNLMELERYREAQTFPAVPPAWRARLARWPIDYAGLLAFGLPFLLYVLTLAPTIYNLDSAEITTAAATGGIMRATGYPLYLILGQIWSRFPVGDIGYRMNLFSAFCGALSIALAERILRRWQVGAWARFGALGLLATGPYVWAMAVIAEVYTLQAALTAGLILLLLRWAERPDLWRLAQVVLLGALSMATTAPPCCSVPGCVWYVLSVAPRRVAPRALAPAAGAGVLGLSIYLYLPLRYAAAPAFNYAGSYDANGVFHAADLSTPAGVWWLVSGRAFAGQMFGYQATELWPEVRNFAVQLWSTFFVIGLGPGLLGLGVLWRRDWRLAAALLLMFVCTAGFYVAYRVVDKNTMFLPAYLIWALWLGLGYQVVLERLAQRVPDAPWRWTTWTARGLVAAPCWPRCYGIGRASTWRRTGACARAGAFCRKSNRTAVIFGWWDTVPPISICNSSRAAARTCRPSIAF